MDGDRGLWVLSCVEWSGRLPPARLPQPFARLSLTTTITHARERRTALYPPTACPPPPKVRNFRPWPHWAFPATVTLSLPARPAAGAQEERGRGPLQHAAAFSFHAANVCSLHACTAQSGTPWGMLPCVLPACKKSPSAFRLSLERVMLFPSLPCPASHHACLSCRKATTKRCHGSREDQNACQAPRRVTTCRKCVFSCLPVPLTQPCRREMEGDTMQRMPLVESPSPAQPARSSSHKYTEREKCPFPERTVVACLPSRMTAAAGPATFSRLLPPSRPAACLFLRLGRILPAPAWRHRPALLPVRPACLPAV